jgi:LysM repeat protein
VEPNGAFELHQVSYPYARPQVQLFVERLASQYVKACGERLVVTSLTRPESEQPRNASDRSVHPTGMAVDLRLARNRSCRRWLEGVLLDLERARVIEATRERRPAHYHIAVFPQAYADYVATKRSETLLVAEVERIPQPEPTAKPEPTPGPQPAPQPQPALEPRTIPYRVRPGDALWTIALVHGTTVERLKSENALASSSIVPGQVLELPTERVERAPAPEAIHYRVRSGDSLWTIAR